MKLPPLVLFPTGLFNFKHFDSGDFVFMTRRSNVIALQLRHQNVRLRTKARWNSAELFVIISILLQVNDCEVSAGNINALTCRIKSHIVGHFSGWQGRDDFAGLGIQDDETWRLAADYENTMIDPVIGDRRIPMKFTQRPSRGHRFLFPVDDSDE